MKYDEFLKLEELFEQRLALSTVLYDLVPEGVLETAITKVNDMIKEKFKELKFKDVKSTKNEVPWVGCRTCPGLHKTEDCPRNNVEDTKEELTKGEKCSRCSRMRNLVNGMCRKCIKKVNYLEDTKEETCKDCGHGEEYHLKGTISNQKVVRCGFEKSKGVFCHCDSFLQDRKSVVGGEREL